MGLSELFRDLAIVGLLAAVVLVVFRRVGIPTIVGFLLTGLVAGPHGFSLVSDSTRVEVLSEIGVILLMFTTGLEFSPGRIGRLRGELVGGGVLQLGATIGLAAASIWVLGMPLGSAVFLGGTIALSSTVIVLRALEERDELHSPHGRLGIGILLFQDLAVIPMMVVAPFLAGRPQGGGGGAVTALLLAVAVIAMVFLAARRIVPHLLSAVVGAKSRELFVITVVAVCLATAAVTSALGIGLALGAFLAGIVISDSDWGHQAFAEILPLRDSLAFLFFVSIGMLVDPRTFVDSAARVAGLTLAVLVGKGLVVFAVALVLRHSMRTAVLGAFALGQIGEFSFVLSRTGARLGLVDPATDRIFLAVVVTTMLVSPFLIAVAPAVASRLPERPDRDEEPLDAALPDSGHVIIAGFGVNGRNLARVLKQSGIPYRILEVSPAPYRRGVEEGEPIRFGDVTRQRVLEIAGIARARSLVLAIHDAEATRRAIRVARSHAPDLHIVVRTRFVAEIPELKDLGASEVLSEEFETSIEIFARVLRHFRVPANVIRLQVELLRRENYGMLRGLPSAASGADLATYLQKTASESLAIQERSRARGRTIAELQFRQETDANVVAIVREGRASTAPDPNLALEVGDVLLVTGSHVALDLAEKIVAPE